MRVGIIVGVIASSALASAQPAPDPVPPPDPAPAPVAAPAAPTIDPRSDAGWTLYHRSFGALAKGDRALAKSLVIQLAHDEPQHPALLQLRTEWPADGVEPPPTLMERPSRGARAELALFQAFHGMALGIELNVLVNTNDGTGYFLLALAGAGAGVGASLAIPDLTPGDRALADSGTAWGEIETGLLLGSLRSSVSGKTVAGALMVGSLGGLGLGAVLTTFHPTQGQVALANSGGIWAGALTTLVLAFADHSTANEHFTETAMVASAAGLVGGAYLAKRYPETSRGRTLVIDAGGIVGGIVALAAGVIFANGTPSDRAATGLAIVGVSAGLGAGAFLTRHWDAEPSSGHLPTAYVVPVERGTGGVAGLQFGW